MPSIMSNFARIIRGNTKKLLYTVRLWMTSSLVHCLIVGCAEKDAFVLSAVYI